MLRIEYDRRQVWKRIIPFQLIPIIAVLYGVGVSNGLLAVRSEAGISVAIVVGCILYGLTMAFMINALRRPTLLSISEGRVLKWRPLFRVTEKQLPPGTRVAVSKDRVLITPSVPDLPGSRSKDQTTVITLPKGLREVARREFTI